MSRTNIQKGQAKVVVNLAEFTHYFRQVHQLAAMKTRTTREEQQLRDGLKKTTMLLQHIHAGTDKQTEKLINYSFRYYLLKKEAAEDGDQVAAKFIQDMRPLFQKELIALAYLN